MALAKMIRGEGPNPNPLFLLSPTPYQSSKQQWMHLLCFDCEQRLHSGGEDWTIPQLLQSDNHFPLRDLVIAHSSREADGQATIFTVSETAPIRIDQLAYFVTSIVWKADAYPWRRDASDLELGRTYHDLFRRYLMGELEFPDDAVVIVDINCRVAVPEKAISDTSTIRANGYRIHLFVTPGVVFRLVVGKNLPDRIRRFCVLRYRRILATDHDEIFKRLIFQNPRRLHK